MPRSKAAERISAYRFQPKQYQVWTPEEARYSAEPEGRNIRREYQQMRRVAEKRIAALSRSGLADTEIYQDNINRFPRLTEIGTDTRLLYDAIAEVSHFLAQKKSTVYGYREMESSALETFTERHEGEGVTGLSWKAFGTLMESIKKPGKLGRKLDDAKKIAQSMAYYRRWRTAYRAAVSRAEKLGLTVEELNEKVSKGLIKIGAAGGLLNAATGRSIKKGWAGLGK